MVIKEIITPLRVETLSFGEAAGFIPRDEPKSFDAFRLRC
jgi:hypothetical protein